MDRKEGSQEGTDGPGEMQAGPKRRHEELFIKPSSRRISDRMRSHVTIHAANIKLCPLVCWYPLEFHMFERRIHDDHYTELKSSGSLEDHQKCIE